VFVTIGTTRHIWGTPYDLWTASAVTGTPGGGGYGQYDVYWEGGYGANAASLHWHPYSETGPLVQYWSISGSAGAFNNYACATVFDIRSAEGVSCPAFYDDVNWLGCPASGSSFVTVSATDTFNLNNGNYYTQYGSYCTIPHTATLLATQPLQSSQSSQILGTTPLFDIQVTYAYIGQRTDQASLPNPIQSQTSINSLNAVSLSPSLICLNAKYISNATTIGYDAAIEVYQIQLITDTGVTESYVYTVGTNINPAFNANQLSTLRPYIERLTQGSVTNAISGYFNSNLTIGNSITGIRVGSAGTYQSDSSGLGFWSAGQPNNATLSVHRLGCILLNGTSTPTYYLSRQATTTQLQLSKYSNGLLYNTVVPQMRLVDPPSIQTFSI
jgi:hypothetical protein